MSFVVELGTMAGVRASPVARTLVPSRLFFFLPVAIPFSLFYLQRTTAHIQSIESVSVLATRYKNNTQNSALIIIPEG